MGRELQRPASQHGGSSATGHDGTRGCWCPMPSFLVPGKSHAFPWLCWARCWVATTGKQFPARRPARALHYKQCNAQLECVTRPARHWFQCVGRTAEQGLLSCSPVSGSFPASRRGGGASLGCSYSKHSITWSQKHLNKLCPATQPTASPQNKTATQDLSVARKPLVQPRI